MRGTYSEEYNRTYPDQPEGPEYAPHSNSGSGTKPSIAKSALAALAAAALAASLFSSDFSVENVQTRSAIFEYEIEAEKTDVITYALFTGGEPVQEGILDFDDTDVLFDNLTPDTRYSVMIFKNNELLDNVPFRTKPEGDVPPPQTTAPATDHTDAATEPSPGISSEPIMESIAETTEEPTEATAEETAEETTEETTVETTEATEATEETQPKKPIYKPVRPRPKPTNPSESTEESSEPTYPSEEETYPSEEEIYPSEEVTYPSEEVTYPSEEETYPSEEVTYPSEGGDIEPTGGGEIPENTGAGGNVPENTGAGGDVNPTEGNAGTGDAEGLSLFSFRNFFSFLMSIIPTSR